MLNQPKSLISAALLLAIINQAYSLSSDAPQAHENRHLESENSLAPSTEVAHAVINIISWGFLIDVGILVSRLGKGRKITINGKVIPAQAFHGAIMSLTIFLSGVMTIVMLSRLDEQKQLQNVLYEGSKVRDIHKIIGYIIGCLSIILVALGILNYRFLKNYNVSIRSKLTITKAHKLLGSLMYLLTKINLILGPIFYKGGDWMIGVYVYLGFMAPFVLLIPPRLRKQYWIPKRLAQIVETPSPLPRHKNLLAAINNGYSTEDIIKQFPGVKWMMLGNKVYDVTDWIHPAGNFTIEPCVGKEIGRYFYGNYSLEGTRIKAHKHSSLSHAQLSTFYIGLMKDPESILLSSHTRREVLSHWDSSWKVRSIKSVSPTTSQIDVSSSDFLIKNFGTTTSWLGSHFKVSFAKNNSMARLYTAAMCLTDANYKLRQSMYHYFDDIMAGNLSTFTFPKDYYLTPNDHLPLFIKKYPFAKKGFSRSIHNLGLDTPIRIEGPILGNMTFSPKAKGEYCIICAGTGILSIIDFLNYFLWQSMYEIIKDKAGVEKAEQINILKLPFDDMKHLKVDFIGSFPNKEEILGLDIIKKLAEYSKKYKRDNFTARIRGYADDYIEPLMQHFSYDFLRKHVNLNQTRYYIVGPRQLNEQVTEALVSLGVPKGKVVLL